MKKEKVTFTYRNGFAKTKFHNISDKHLKTLQQAVNNEILRREDEKKRSEFTQKKPKRKFGRKLRRFIHRLNFVIVYHAEHTAVNHIVGSEQAMESPYIGIEDYTHKIICR